MYAPLLLNRVLAVSFVTVGELFFWAKDDEWGEHGTRILAEKLRSYIVVHSDDDIVRIYGEIVTERKRQGRPMAQNDAWIAACAVWFGVPLVSHNAKDFFGIARLELLTAGS